MAFACAGAKKLILIGRHEGPLQETQQALGCDSTVHAADVTDEKALAEIAAVTGAWDILILAAGYLAGPASIRESSIDDWWKSFEVWPYPAFPYFSQKISRATLTMRQTNVKGTMIATNVFLPTANPTHAAVVALTAAVVFPAARIKGLSAYISSKLALIKFVEFLAAENPTVFAAALHPGMIDTNILRSSGADPSALPLDSGKQSSTHSPPRSKYIIT